MAGPLVPENLSVTDALRLRRLALKLKQSDVARLSGLQQSYISGVERGERNLSLDNLEKIACALGCRITLDLL